MGGGGGVGRLVRVVVVAMAGRCTRGDKTAFLPQWCPFQPRSRLLTGSLNWYAGPVFCQCKSRDSLSRYVASVR